jgi:nucleoside-diphosphate-sugar epimerase
MSAPRALVVGGTGPTGPYVVQGLRARGFDVAMLHSGRHEVPETPPEVEHLHADAYSGEAVEQALHSRRFDAAIVSYGRLREIARVLRDRVDVFVGVGGVPLYRGWMRPEDFTPAGLPVPTAEEAPKVESESELRKGFMILRTEEAVFEHHPRGVMFRYPHVYGPRQLVPREWSIVRRILDGRRFILLPEGGLSLHTFGYAENLAHALLLAVDRPDAAAGQSYNCGDEQTLTLRQVVEHVARCMDAQLEILSLPEEVALPGQPLLSHETAHHRVMDLSKLRRELGYRDVVGPAEGLRRTVDWLLANRPERGSLTERILGDTFDYAAEDRLAAIARDALARMREVEYAARPGPGLSYVAAADRAKRRRE